MGRADYYAPGDHNAVCFECGKKFKASTLKKHWQGYYVCEEHWEPRHPQDFVRSVQDVQTPPWAQPIPADHFLWENTTGLITASATLVATDSEVSVGSSGDLTIYLPATPSSNQILVINNVGTGTVTVDGNGHTIGAVTTITLAITVNGHFYWDGYTWGVWYSDCAASVLNLIKDFGSSIQGPSDTPYTIPAASTATAVWWENTCSETVNRTITATYAGSALSTGKTDYALPSFGEAVAFDPVTGSVWVTSTGIVPNKVSKVNITDGTRVDYSVNTGAYGIAFDNVTNSIWVSNATDGNVSKVNITDGTRTDYSAGSYPIAVTFDSGTSSIWVSNQNGNSVSKFNITTGTRVDYPVGTNPHGLAFDSVTSSVWVANYSDNTISKVNTTTGTKVDYATGAAPYAVAFDNVTNSIWVTNLDANTVSKINVTTGTKVDYATGTGPAGISFDASGECVWVTNSSSSTVSKINVNDGTKVDYATGTNPIGVAVDTTTGSVWVANINSSNVSKLTVDYYLDTHIIWAYARA